MEISGHQENLHFVNFHTPREILSWVVTLKIESPNRFMSCRSLNGQYQIQKDGQRSQKIRRPKGNCN